MTGSSGLLGTEIKKHDSALLCPDMNELDITDLAQLTAYCEKQQPDVILHLAAATAPPEHEKSPVLGLEVNIKGTANIVLAAHKIGAKVVYTSTDYLYVGKGPHKEDEPIKPPYKFGFSKVGGECAIQLYDNSLILRLSFGPVPFPTAMRLPILSVHISFTKGLISFSIMSLTISSFPETP